MKKNEQDRTRDVIARSILEQGPATAASLAKKLSMTPAGIRRHLDSLIEDGILESREEHTSALNHRGRGRPSRVFLMSDAGRAKFAHSYDDLAVAALAFMRQKSSSAANGVERSIDLVAEFAQLRGDELVNRAWKGAKDSSRGGGEQSSVRSRSELIANLLSEDGFAATVHETGRGVQICQHHCPVAHVAAAFPELCEAETAAISKIAGTHVQRLATIAHGDGVCTTYIPDLHMPEITSRS